MTTPFEAWRLELDQVSRVPLVLLCGAKHWEGSPAIPNEAYYQRANWVTTDMLPGPEVDICCDLQTLWQTHEHNYFDGIFCPSVLEHIERPWVAMHSMGKLLKPGGVLFVQTHQTFPLHNYPNDYFRFSIDAMKTLCFDTGLIHIATDYGFPCTITPHTTPSTWNTNAPAFLNVDLCAKKPL